MSLEIQKLDNGITVIANDIPFYSSIALGVWAPIGTRDETEAQNGLSHFIEHMAFKGTHNRSTKQIAIDIESIGGVINAWTSHTATAWYGRVLGDKFSTLASVLCDILRTPLFSEKEIEKERNVILQEISQAQDYPDDVLMDAFHNKCWENQPLGQNILGTKEKISAYSREDLISWLHNKHLSSELIIVAVGNVNKEKLFRWAKDSFGDLKVKKHNREKAQWTGGEVLIERELEQVQFQFGFNGFSYSNIHRYPAQILSILLGGGMSSRLFQEIREKLGLVYGIGSYHQSFADTGSFVVYGATTPDNIKEVLQKSSFEFKKAAEHISEDEIIKAKTQLMTAIVMTDEGLMSAQDRLARHILTHGRMVTMEETKDMIMSVKKDDIFNAISEMMNSDIAYAAVGPKEALLDKSIIEEIIR